MDHCATPSPPAPAPHPSPDPVLLCYEVCLCEVSMYFKESGHKQNNVNDSARFVNWTPYLSVY
jgi:hypothetical protein